MHTAALVLGQYIDIGFVLGGYIKSDLSTTDLWILYTQICGYYIHRSVDIMYTDLGYYIYRSGISYIQICGYHI